MNRLSMVSALLMVLALLAMPVLAESQYKEFVGAGGVVNWSNGTVSAEGNGLAPAGGNPKTAGLLACRAAVADAQRNLLEATKGVRVTSNTLVQDFVVKSDEIRTTVEGVVKGATMLDRSQDDSGVCKVVLRMGMGGKMSNTLYKSTFQSQDQDSVSRSAPANSFLNWWNNARWIASAHAAAREPAPDRWTSAYEALSDRLTAIEKRLAIIPESTIIRHAEILPTGLVVDARGSNFIPSLSPNIRQIRGRIIYPNRMAQGSILGSGQLVALFSRDVDFAMRHPKVGERPLLLKGLRTWGKTRTEIVLGEQSASKVIELAETDFFSTAGVIIVLD